MNEIDRGFEGVLQACSRDTDPIFFDCPPHFFPNEDGSYTIYEIKNGILTKETCDIPDDPPTMNFKRVVEIEDRVISGSFDESMRSQLYYFNDHIAQLAANYFSTIVLHIKLVFGINEEAINNDSDKNSVSEDDDKNIFVLLNGSTVITLEYQVNAHVSRPEITSLVEKVMSSNKNSSIQESVSNQNKDQNPIVIENRKVKKRNKAYYASDSLSVIDSEYESNEEEEEDKSKKEDGCHSEYSAQDFIGQYNPDSQIIAAIDYEINREIDHTYCITNAVDCGPPKYHINRIVVALYNLHLKFPNFGDSELYYQLKLRFPHPNEKVPCCVQCYHIYMASDRVCRACKKSAALTFELPPQPFQPLVATELNKRGKMPINSTTIQKNDPHSFFLNIVQSPYKDPVFLIPEPQKTGAGKKKNSSIKVKKRSSYSNSRCSTSYSSNKRESTPSWVTRLAGDDPDAASNFSRRGTRTLCMSSLMKYRAANMNDLPYYLTPVGYSESLAPNKYYRPPFDIAKLDPKRKRKLHVLPKKTEDDD